MAKRAARANLLKNQKPPLLHPMYSNGGGFSINRGSTPVCRSKPVTAACRAVILHFPTACCPGALYTAVCKQAPSQWPVLSAQTNTALLCPGKRICPFTSFIIAGSRAEVKAAGFFRPFPFTSSASCAIIYFIKGKAAARAALGCRERKKRGFLMRDRKSTRLNSSHRT